MLSFIIMHAKNVVVFRQQITTTTIELIGKKRMPTATNNNNNNNCNTSNTPYNAANDSFFFSTLFPSACRTFPIIRLAGGCREITILRNV